MSVTRPLCAAFASMTLISALGGLWVQDTAEVPPYKPVARVSSLMAGIGSAFGNLRDVVPQAVFPMAEDEHRFRKIIAWSEVIAELSNVHTRYRRNPDYLEMAADTRSIALDLARVARADTPDEAQLTTLFENLDNSCTTCHDADQ